jgi:hypothetical protein
MPSSQPHRESPDAPASPYDGVDVDGWTAVTSALLASFPTSGSEIVACVQASWDDLAATQLGRHGLRIGAGWKPSAAVTGELLRTLIASNFARLWPGTWRPAAKTAEKDIVCLTDANFSIDIKTSTDANEFFSEKGYAERRAPSSKYGPSGANSRSGYYLVVNFDNPQTIADPGIGMIRFGWLAHDDFGKRGGPGGRDIEEDSSARRKFTQLFVRNS